MHDVYAYGVIAPSTLIDLIDDFPPRAGYAEIGAVYPSIGGEAAGGAYVLARLGVATKLSGNRLGDDASAHHARDLLMEAGVDCSAISLEGPPTVTEVVFASGQARTVFGTYRRLTADQAWSAPSQDDVRSSRIVCLDPFFGDASQQVAAWCLDAGIPYVTVDVAPDAAIAQDAAVIVISEEFANRTVPASDPRAVLRAYTQRCRGLVILTQGSERLLYGRGTVEAQEAMPFSVGARDTTGAGDSFRAGIIYGMLHGHGDERLIRTASAVAALVCQRIPGVLPSPTEQELTDFLDQNP